MIYWQELLGMGTGQTETFPGHDATKQEKGVG
jgi:hypothetical protein